MFAYAQKTELAEAQKALDKKDYAAALSQAEKADALLKQDEAAAPAQIAKAMYIKGMAKLALAGTDEEKAKEAITELTALLAYEDGKNYSARKDATKKTVTFNSQKELDDAMIAGGYSKPKVTDRVKTYTQLVRDAIGAAAVQYQQQAVQEYNNNQYPVAADLFALAFEAQKAYLPKADTALLNNSATCMILARDYAGAKKYYQQLLDLNYTGIETIYEATDELSGQRKIYPSKKEMETQVKLKLASDPEERVEPDKQPEIYLTMIQILFQEEDFDKALDYSLKAMEKYPTNKDFLLIAGQIYYRKGDLDNFLKMLLDAEVKYPDDAEVQYNLGYVYGEKKDAANSAAHYLKAIEIDPKYANAYINYASLLLDDEQKINEEIDKLPFTLNAAQKKQYDALLAQKKEMYKKVADILEKGHAAVPDNLSMIRILKNVYLGLDDQANSQKYEAMEKEIMGM